MEKRNLKTAILQFRTTEKQRLSIEQAAVSNDKSLSEFLRDEILHAVRNNQ